MIAAKRRRNRPVPGRLRMRLRALPGRAKRELRTLPARCAALTRRVDRGANRVLGRAAPPLARGARRLAAIGKRAARRLRPLAIVLLRLLSRVERLLLRTAAWAQRNATRASAVLTPQRGICLAILGAAACLGVAQFVDYRAVEIGQPGYAGLPAASAPSVAAETAGQAHAYLLLPVALLAAALAVATMRNERRRGLGRVVFALGLLSLAVILLVDLPAGLDVGTEASRFSGATAVLYDGFYAEIAAAAGLMLGGVLLLNAHRVPARHGYRPRKPSLARTQGGRRARTSRA